MMSGHCIAPAANVPDPHSKCRGGNRANPDKEWQVCPCVCHLGEEYECGNCGRPIREAPMWRDFVDDEDMVYVHLDKDGTRAIGEECPPGGKAPVHEADEAEAEAEEEEVIEEPEKTKKKKKKKGKKNKK